MCENVLFLVVFKIVNSVIAVLKIALPLIIIVMGSVDLLKFATKGTQEEFTATVKKFAYRFVAAVVIFFLPTIIKASMGIIDNYDNNYVKCAFNVDNEMIELAKSRNAVKAVENAEKNPTYQNVSMARRYVSKTANDSDKSALTARLDVVQQALDDEREQQRKGEIEEAKKRSEASKSTAPTVDGQTQMSGASNQEKIKKVFPNGVPTSAAEVEKYLINVTVPITTKDGVKTTTTVQVHKAISGDVIAALTAAQNEGFKVYEILGYRQYGSDPAGAVRDVGLNYSQHCYGLAVDINVNENCYKKPATAACSTGNLYDPGNNPYSITTTGALYKSFISNGWGWGGNWNSLKDYMHFSFFGN